MTEHRTSESDCPDCSGFERCDYHEGVRHGREEKEDEVRDLLNDLEDEFHRGILDIDYVAEVEWIIDEVRRRLDELGQG